MKRADKNQDGSLPEIPEAIRKDCEFVFYTLLEQNKRVISSSKKIGISPDDIFRALCISYAMSILVYLKTKGKIKFQ